MILLFIKFSITILFTNIKEMIIIKDFYLLVAGSRNFTNYKLLCSLIELVLKNHMNDNIHIVAGEAKGVDTLAKKYAYEKGYTYHGFPADWSSFGTAAGRFRNVQMHKYISSFTYRGVLCIWDGKSPGTKQNFEISKEYKNPIRVYNYITNKFIII